MNYVCCRGVMRPVRLIFNLILILLPCFSLGLHAQDAAPEDSVSIEELMEELPEVLVKGGQPIARMEPGKLVFDMPRLQEQFPADNAYELLKRIPGVTESDGAFSMAGQTLTLILNGKPSLLTSEQLAQFLQGVPAGALRSAEVMISAPPQYGIRGAVINIITGSEKRDMLTGQLQATWNIDKYSRGYGKGALMYRHDKFSLDAVYSHTNGSNYNSVEHIAVQPLATGPEAYAESQENDTRNIIHDYYADADYAFAENHSINLAYTGKWLSTHSSNTSEQDATFFQRGVTHNYLNALDAQYTAPFGLKLRAAWLLYQYPQEQTLAGSIDGDDKSRTADSRQRISKWHFSAAETHSLKKQWEINYGAKLQLTNQKSWQTTRSPEGEIISDGTDRVDYTERIFSAYAGFGKSWGQKVSVGASAEVENYHTPYINDWRIYPAVNLLWTANQSNLLNLSFSSNSAYPSYWSMMNSVYYSTTYDEIWGNPDLVPQRDYNINLTWRFKQKYVFSAFADFSPECFMQVPYQPSDRMAMVMKIINFNYRNDYGFQASAQFSAGDRLNGNVTATMIVIHDKADDYYDIPFDRRTVAGVFSANLSYTLWRAQNLVLIVNPFYQTGVIQGAVDIKPLFKLYGSLRWTSRNDRWTVSAACSNITNSRITLCNTWQNQNLKMNIAQAWRTFSLALTYKFGKYQERRRRDVDTSRMGH